MRALCTYLFYHGASLGLSAVKGKGVGGPKRERKGERTNGRFPDDAHCIFHDKHLEYNSFRDDHMTQLNMVPF